MHNFCYALKNVDITIIANLALKIKTNPYFKKFKVLSCFSNDR